MDALDEFFVAGFFEFGGCFVEYVALAELHGFVELCLQRREQFARDAGGFGEVGFGAVLVGLEESDVDDVVFELSCFLPVGSDDDAEE